MLTAAVFSILLGVIYPTVQDTLTLQQCYSRIDKHYPLARKIELQEEITKLNKKIVHRAFYPQVELGAAATYQSEVTEFSAPEGGAFSGPDLSKDHYKLNMEVTQSIYNGGAVGIREELEAIRGRRQQQSTQVELHQLKRQVNTVYFGILLARQQLDVFRTLSEDLRSQIRSITSQVQQGVMLPSQKYILQAELIRLRQDTSEVLASIRSGFRVLSQLIGQKVSPDASLRVPSADSSQHGRHALARLRPEFELFESGRRALQYRKDLARNRRIPSLAAFGTAAYGRPGFNVFENDLHPYYMVGLRLKWNFWNSLDAASRIKIYDLQQKSLDEEERAFERQLRSALAKIEERIRFLQLQIEQDKQIVGLREKVVAITSSQLKNGAATATEYVTELNNATQARISLNMHRIQLAREKIEYQTTLGITTR